MGGRTGSHTGGFVGYLQMKKKWGAVVDVKSTGRGRNFM